VIVEKTNTLTTFLRYPTKEEVLPMYDDSSNLSSAAVTFLVGP
jgi:hypothetical protein